MSENEPSVTGAVYRQTSSGLPTAVPSVPGVKDLQVQPDQVDAVAKIIHDQAEQLEQRLAQRLGQLWIDPPSEDIVSKHAVEAWNEVVVAGEGSYEKQVRSYVEGLRTLADQLRTASQTYQVNEDATVGALEDRRVHPA
ncbi:hypothetical protein [Amycolatopsis sp. 195334CR]|uniref:hypothetical protein n=1 Tax=Amycolatopsis sp. 195334CR TaxID=2814588 RepID=UPI001F5C33DF|nr:hypothetical protein [Amycolatopsis sp. 195334CR]